MPICFAQALPVPIRDALHSWVQQELARDGNSLLAGMMGKAWAGPKRGPEEAPSAAESLVALLRRHQPRLAGLRWDIWGVILWEGASLGWHDHHQALYGAVAYLEVPPDAGPIVFDSGPVVPRERDVVLFGGRTRHCVEAGGGPRVSVALNFYGR